jgi:hypothetical protein
LIQLEEVGSARDSVCNGLALALKGCNTFFSTVVIFAKYFRAFFPVSNLYDLLSSHCIGVSADLGWNVPVNVCDMLLRICTCL